MKPALAALAAKVRADGSWPTVLEYGTLLCKAGASATEAISMARDYKKALFSGRWPEEDEPVSAEEKLMASLRSFSLGLD